MGNINVWDVLAWKILCILAVWFITPNSHTDPSLIDRISDSAMMAADKCSCGVDEQSALLHNAFSGHSVGLTGEMQCKMVISGLEWTRHQAWAKPSVLLTMDPTPLCNWPALIGLLFAPFTGGLCNAVCCRWSCLPTLLDPSLFTLSCLLSILTLPSFGCPHHSLSPCHCQPSLTWAIYIHQGLSVLPLHGLHCHPLTQKKVSPVNNAV